MCVNANEIFTIHTGTQPSTLSLLLFQKEMYQTGCEFTSSAASLAPLPYKFEFGFSTNRLPKRDFPPWKRIAIKGNK